MTTEPIRRKEDIEAIKKHFLQGGSVRNYALFVLGINTGIRVSELVAVRWGDVYDNDAKKIHPRLFSSAKKTRKRIAVALNDSCKTAIAMLLEAKNGRISPADYLFESKAGGHITRFTAFKIMKRASERLGLDGNIGCQSMGKTLGYHALKEGPGAAALMSICRQSEFEGRMRLLGAGPEEAGAPRGCPNL